MVEWRQALGDAWQHLQGQYLIPLGQSATFYPNPCNPGGAPLNVIANRDGTFEATPTNLSLQAEDVQLHRWSLSRFRNSIAQALGMEPASDAVHAGDRFIPLGRYRLSRGEEYPAYWMLVNEGSNFCHEATRLILKRRSPFFLMTGTRSDWNTALQNDMSDHNSPLLALSEILEFRDGQFTATEVWHGAIEAFRKTLHPKKLIAVPDYQFARLPGWEFYFAGARMIPKEEVVGFYMIQRLLQYPHELIYAGELERLVSEQGFTRTVVPINANDETKLMGDMLNYDEILDREAREKYRQRLQDLAEQRRLARKHSDLAKEKEIDDEYGMIENELNHSKNIHGKTRKLDTSNRNLSKRIAKNIDTAIEKIRIGLPDFAQFLTNTIHRGLYCFYAPHEIIDWQF